MVISVLQASGPVQNCEGVLNILFEDHRCVFKMIILLEKQSFGRVVDTGSNKLLSEDRRTCVETAVSIIL